MYRALAMGALGFSVPFQEAVRLAAANGFAGVDVGMAEIRELGLEGVQRLLEENQLIAAQTGLPVNFREDDETFERDLAGLPAFAQVMTELGCRRVATWLLPYHETLSYGSNFERLRARTARICDVLARYGMRYGLEFVGPETMRSGKPNPFIHDLGGILELIAAVDADNFGILLDAFHWYTSGGTAEDLDQLTDNLVVVVHVNDATAGLSREEQIDQQRALPGETGVIDIATFMRALNRMRYTGPVVVEPFSQRLREMSPENAVSATAASLDRIWDLAGL